jgi:hypothetical protein
MRIENGRLVERTRPDNWAEMTAEQRAHWDMGLQPEPEPTEAELEADAEILRRRTAAADRYGLSVDEIAHCEETGTDPVRYGAMKGVSNLGDFEDAQKRLRLDAEARAEAERQAAVEQAKRRLAAERSGDEAA